MSVDMKSGVNVNNEMKGAGVNMGNSDDNKGISLDKIERFANEVKEMDTVVTIIKDRIWTSNSNFRYESKKAKVIVVNKYKHLVDVIDLNDFSKIVKFNSVEACTAFKNVYDIKEAFGLSDISEIKSLNGIANGINGVGNIIRTMSWLDLYMGCDRDADGDVINFKPLSKAA